MHARSVTQSCPTLFDCSLPGCSVHVIDSPGKNTGVGCHFLLQRIFLTQDMSLFNLYADYIIRNAGLEEAQAGIMIAGRNINNLRYADDTTLSVNNDKIIGLEK